MLKISVSLLAFAVDCIGNMNLSAQEELEEVPIESNVAIVVRAANAGMLFPYFHPTRIPPV